MADKTKILYVDDEVMNLFLFENLLSQYYEVVTADNPGKALEILKKETNIQLVVSDMKMPRMNGLQFIQKAKEFYDKCPYLILSGYHKGEEIEEALENGLIIDYLQKPYEVSDIVKSLDKAIETFNSN